MIRPAAVFRCASLRFAVIYVLADAELHRNGAKMPRVNWGVLQEAFPGWHLVVEACWKSSRRSFGRDAGATSGSRPQIQNLRRTRDLLLPRLLSGQVAVDALSGAISDLPAGPLAVTFLLICLLISRHWPGTLRCTSFTSLVVYISWIREYAKKRAAVMPATDPIRSSCCVRRIPAGPAGAWRSHAGPAPTYPALAAVSRA